jgi:hypothetical protein
VRNGLPLQFPLLPSPGFALLIVVAHVAAAACFLTILKGWAGTLGAVLLLGLGCAAAWDRALLRSSRSPRAIVIDGSTARCLQRNGDAVPIVPPGGSGVGRHWIALRLASARRSALLVTRGMLAPESFRLLRLWARWGKLPGVAARQLRV